jgi:hypothetical protein
MRIPLSIQTVFNCSQEFVETKELDTLEKSATYSLTKHNSNRIRKLLADVWHHFCQIECCENIRIAYQRTANQLEAGSNNAELSATLQPCNPNIVLLVHHHNI